MKHYRPFSWWGLRDTFSNRLAVWRASRSVIPDCEPAPVSTSVSDYREYRNIVAAASKSDIVFKSFRSHPDYSPILEHVTEDLGRSYLEIVQERGDLLGGWLDRIKTINVLGGPPRFHYKGFGRLSPTTLRYLKVYSDLVVLFGRLDEMTCVEVGVGFGGQSVILNQLGGVQSFHLFDLPPVLDLAQKFIGLAGCNANFQLHDGSSIDFGPRSDIFVSNYAFSELAREFQQKYLDQVISQASRGYITWNRLSQDGFHPRELIELIPGSRILPERPLTHPDNCIIVWGSVMTLPD